MIVAITSGKGSPGATTLALALTLSWPRPVILIEADPAGASIGLGYGGGTDLAGRNLTQARVAARRSGWADAIAVNLVQLGDDMWLLPGVADSSEAAAIDQAALADATRGLGADVLIDLGRVLAPVSQGPLLEICDQVWVVTRSTLPAVHAAQVAAADIRRQLASAHRPELGSVIIGAGRPYPRSDIETAMATVAPVLDVVPWDVPAAGVLADAAPPIRHLAGSRLLRGASSLAQKLTKHEPARAVADPGPLVADLRDRVEVGS